MRFKVHKTRITFTARPVLKKFVFLPATARLKKRFLLLPVMLSGILIFSSCAESQITKVSVGDEFSAVGSGVMKATLEAEHESLKLSAEMELMYGEMMIWLANPNGDTIYSRSFQAVYNDHFDTTFTPMPGEWIFSYKILKMDEVNPSGTFQFSLIY